VVEGVPEKGKGRKRGWVQQEREGDGGLWYRVYVKKAA
jgi:hypothetical protein